MVVVGFAEDRMMDRVSHISQLHPTSHAPCDMLYECPRGDLMLIGACDPMLCPNWGFRWACSDSTRVRVARALGAGDTRLAQFSLRVAAAISLTTAVTVSGLLALLRDRVSYTFSSDETVHRTVTQIMTLVSSAYAV